MNRHRSRSLRAKVGLVSALLALPILPFIGSPEAEAVAAPPAIQVGVGQADITPPTGSYKGGWACSCARASGQHTRLYARAIVIKSGTTKVALVTEDLFALSAGMVRDAAALLPGRGLDETNIVASATHTHSSQSGYMNHSVYNSVLMSTDNLHTLTSFQLLDTAADQTMYNFMTRQLALALSRADDDLTTGKVGWGHTTLYGVTQNRSLEAHLAAYGIDKAPGTGTVDDDPNGYAGTIDPSVDLLRIDQIRNGQTVPVGVYTTFANHGTVDKADFSYYSADHQGSAERGLSEKIRAAAHLPADSEVVSAFANSDAGDMSSGLDRSGPAAADEVGREEAAAMFTAWQAAGRAMTTSPIVSMKWTRMCMCGQSVDGHATDSNAWGGAAALAGSEEGRGLGAQLGVAHEGDRLLLSAGPQGRKIRVLNETGSMPGAVPLAVLRIGDQLIATVPGEPTVGAGRLLRSSIEPIVDADGVNRVVIAGYAGEYLDYWTTPEEFEAQHYEGGSTVYGKYSFGLIVDGLAGLASDLVTGDAAPAPYAYDPNRGVHVTDAAYGDGAGAGLITDQPHAVQRLGHPSLSWTGGANGIDRPVDTAFVTVQRVVNGSWQTYTTDIDTEVLWSSSSSGDYKASWEPSLSAPTGTYRLVITAKRYRLTSRTFTLSASTAPVAVVSGDRVRLRYPEAVVNQDWTARPESADAAEVTFDVDGRLVTVAGGVIPSGNHVSVPAGGARDTYDNTNAEELTLS